jgi:hypothetical protein
VEINEQINGKKVNKGITVIPFRAPKKTEKNDAIVEHEIENSTTASPKDYKIITNGWISVRDTIPESLKNLGEIWVLEVWNTEKIIIPDWLKNLKIENLSFVNKISSKNIKKLKNLLPEIKIYVARVRVQ